EAGCRIGRNRDNCWREVDLVSLRGERLFVRIQGFADGDGTGRERQGDRAAAFRSAERCDMKPPAEAFLEAGDGNVIGRHAFALQTPRGTETEIRDVQRDLLR